MRLNGKTAGGSEKFHTGWKHKARNNKGGKYPGEVAPGAAFCGTFCGRGSTGAPAGYAGFSRLLFVNSGTRRAVMVV